MHYEEKFWTEDDGISYRGNRATFIGLMWLRLIDYDGPEEHCQRAEEISEEVEFMLMPHVVLDQRWLDRMRRLENEANSIAR